MARRSLTLSVLLIALFAAAPFAQAPAQQAASAESVAGATNFCPLDVKFASGGVTSAEAFATLKSRGFRTVVNLQTAGEPGVDIPAESAAVQAAGMNYVSLPFSSTTPDPAAVEKFLDLAKEPANLPIYIHCRSGQRANAFWLIKRALVDGWTTEKALAEADALKMNNEALRKFALGYIADHKQRDAA